MEIQIEKKEEKTVDEKIRVVAYTRVSSLEKNGFHSSESQKNIIRIRYLPIQIGYWLGFTAMMGLVVEM